MSVTDNLDNNIDQGQRDDVLDYKTEYEKTKNALDETKKHLSILNKENADKRHKLNESILELEKIKKEYIELHETYTKIELEMNKTKRNTLIKDLATKLGFRSFNDAILNTPDSVNNLEEHLKNVLINNPHYKIVHQQNIGTASNPPTNRYINKNPNYIINNLLRDKLK